MTLFSDCPDVIKNKLDKINMTSKRTFYLQLQRPMTLIEKQEFEKISLYLEIQKEINKNKKKLIKKESIFVI